MKLLLPSLLTLAFLPLSASLLLNACGTLAGNPEEDTGGEKTETATVDFMLADAPIAGIKSVFITVAQLEVLQSNTTTWISVPLKTQAEIDLLELQDGRTLALASAGSLPAGTYTQTRLILADDSSPRLIEADGSEHYLKIPSAHSSGLKVQTPFSVTAGESVQLTLDFDLRKSIKKTGPGKQGGGSAHGKKLSEVYMMSPVLRLVQDKQTGVLKGSWPGASTICVYNPGDDKDDNDECDNSANSAKVRGKGAFTIAHLPAGTYELRAFFDDGTISDHVPVTLRARQELDLGELP